MLETGFLHLCYNLNCGKLVVICYFLIVTCQTLQDIEDALSSFQGGPELPSKNKGGSEQNKKDTDCIKIVRSEFHAKMSDDLNTAQILTGAFQDALKFANSSLTALKVCIWNQCHT